MQCAGLQSGQIDELLQRVCRQTGWDHEDLRRFRHGSDRRQVLEGIKGHDFVHERIDDEVAGRDEADGVAIEE